MSANVLAKIVDFQSLTPGWCYGEGFPFDERLLNKAIELATSLLGQGFEQLDAFPGLNGEVRVTAYQRSPRGNRYYLEFTLEPSDHVITFLCEADGAEEVYREGLSFAECQLLIKNYGRRLCNSYWLSIPGTSTENWRVSRVWPLGHRPQEEGYRSLPESAPLKSVETSVNTYGPSTGTSAANRQFIGCLKATSCLPATCSG